MKIVKHTPMVREALAQAAALSEAKLVAVTGRALLNPENNLERGRVWRGMAKDKNKRQAFATERPPKSSSSQCPTRPASAALLAVLEKLADAGIRARSWANRRIYIYGYGPDITAYLEEADGMVGRSPADSMRLVVLSSWHSNQQALRCKAVRHALWRDLYALGLLTRAPPAHWRDTPLEPVAAIPARSYRGEPPPEREPHIWCWPLA